MRILYTVARTNPGTASGYLLDLVAGLGRELDLHIAAPGPGEFLAAAQRAGATCHIVADLDWARSPWRASRAIRQVSKLVRKLEPDLIDAHDCKAGIIARYAGKHCKVPVVYTAHDWLEHDRGGALRRPCALLEWMAARSSACVVAGSDEARRAMMHRGIDALQTTTIRRGASDEAPRAHPARAAVPMIAVASRFDGSSNDALILEAFAGVDSPAVLTFLGEGHTLAWMRGLAMKLGIGGRVRFQSSDDLPQTLARAHLFAWVGKAQTDAPAPVVEAMRAGLPVVALDTGVVHEAITNGENGYMVPAGDIAGFRNGLWALAADSALRKRMGEAGRFRFEQNFSMEQMLTKTEELYDRVCGGGISASGAPLTRSAAMR